MTAVLFIGEDVSHPARCGKNAGAFLNFDGESPAIRSPAVPSERIWKYFALSVAFPSQKCAKDARDIPQCKSTEKNGSPEKGIINYGQRKQETARPRSFRDVQWRESSRLICIHFNVLSSDKTMNRLYRFALLSEFLFNTPLFKKQNKETRIHQDLNLLPERIYAQASARSSAE